MAAKAKTATLVNGVATEFALTGVVRGDRVDVTVHGGANTVYVRMDGVDPVVAADETYPVLSGTTRRFSFLGDAVKVIAAAGTPVVTVARAGG